MLKRYLLFAYQDYYPSGGWDDFKDSFDILEAANKVKAAYESDGYPNVTVVDSFTGKYAEDVECQHQTTNP